MKIRDLNILEAVEAELVNDQKEAVIRTVKEYQIAIKKAKRAVKKLEEALENFLDKDINEVMTDPDSGLLLETYRSIAYKGN